MKMEGEGGETETRREEVTTSTHTHTNVADCQCYDRARQIPPHAALIDAVLSLVWIVYFVFRSYDVCIRKDLQNILTLTAQAQI